MTYKKIYISPNEILKGAVKSTLIAEANKKSMEYFNSKEFKEREQKNATDVANLMHQVVGGEVY